MRVLILMCASILAACAGQPSAPSPAPTTNMVASSASTPAKTSATPPAGKIDAESLARAKKLGFTPVNQNGAVLYCRSDIKTGSHVERETVCLTMDEIESLRNQTQQQMSDFARRAPPPVTK